MKITLIILFVLSGFFGCIQQSSHPPSSKINHTLKSDFSTEFDRLFISNEPLQYQDNVTYLNAIRLDELNLVEKNNLISLLTQKIAN